MSQANPRPGKLGDEHTRQTIAEDIAEFEKQGYLTDVEEKIMTPKGKKSKRFMDVSLWLPVIVGASGAIVTTCYGCNPTDLELFYKAASGAVASPVLVRLINYGLLKANRQPIKREAEALEDVRQAIAQTHNPPNVEFKEKRFYGQTDSN